MSGPAPIKRGSLSLPEPEPDSVTGYKIDAKLAREQAKELRRRRTPQPVDVDGVSVMLRQPLTHEVELRLKYPAAGMKADIDESREAAIRGKCLSCAGSDTEVGRCQVHVCWLWAVRPYRDPDNMRPDGVVPTVEEYTAMRNNKYAGASSGAGAAALAAFRAAKKAGSGSVEPGDQ